MHQGFFNSWNDLQLRKKFVHYIEKENGKRFVMLLSIVGLSQILFLLLELIGVFELTSEVLYSRVLVTIACGVFVLIVTTLRKKIDKSKHFKILSTTKAILHLFILAIGCYFTIFMFSRDVFTYSPFIITAVLISVTHVRWPVFSNSFLLGVFILLSIYLSTAFNVPSYFVGESITAGILIGLISIVNILNYRRFWNAFVQEEKIKEMNELLTDISHKDELTGLYNRRRIIEDLEEFINIFNRYKIIFSVTMVDLDYFKKVNDKFGHNTGDEVLCEFSKALVALLRDSDIVGRWGGEEFIVITPNTDKDGAYKLIERARRKIEKRDFKNAGNLTFSAGVCEYTAEYSTDVVVDNADFALYLSKQLGRNKVSIFASESK